MGPKSCGKSFNKTCAVAVSVEIQKMPAGWFVSERDFHFAATYNCDATGMVTLFEFPMDRNTLKNPHTNPGDL